MKSLFCSLFGASFALASTVTAKTATFDANYDNLTTTEAGPPAPLETYDFLAYSSFSVLSNSLDLEGGIAPHSEPIYVGPDPQPTVTPSFAVVPPYKTFSLKSFWFGCDADLDQGLANQAVQCTVTLAAFKEASDQEVAVASFTFTPPPNLVTQVPMIQAVLPDGFENVYSVTIVQNDPSVIGLGIDNLEYTVST